ncbi:MAG TPA: hypothetical protein VNP89_12010 [Gaiellaceae bacterium]|nr:hypothetical protein [Gaiellaceae bacterium]
MAKRVDPLKAKEAKQKKIAIAGAVLLLALLGFQGPKTLKMLQGPQPVTAPTSTAPATTTPGVTPAPGTTTAAGEVPVAPAPELSAVADSDLSPEAVQGQLATFERFASKDPFAQQAEPVATAPPRVSDPKDGTETTPVDTKNDADKADGADGDATDGGFTTGGSTPDAPEIAAATSISVNGVAEDVATEGSFPKEEPTFVLVKVAKNGKSIEIGIAGGEYASGGETITLGLGKKLTLQNTADGSRYELELLTIQGSPVPKQKK